MKTIRESFSARLSLQVVMIAFVVFMAVFAVVFFSSKSIVRQEAESHAGSELSGTVYQIEDILHQVEAAAKNMEWIVHNHIDNPDTLYAMTRMMIKSNPHVIGSCVAFEPWFYAGKGELFAPYSYITDEGVVKDRNLGYVEYNYHAKDWYATPKRLDRDYWSEPYFDEGGGDRLMSTYSHVLRDGKGKMFGVLTADISLDRLSGLVNGMKPYPGSYTLMISRLGNYLVHPKPERILHETIYTATMDMTDRSVTDLGDAMIRGEEGIHQLQNDDTLSYVFFKPVEGTEWSVAVVCPYRDVFAPLDKLSLVLVSVFMVGLLALLLFCVWSIRRAAYPLKLFSEAASRVAEGDLSTPLPEIRTKDELAHFRDSFAYMQRSLDDYICRLTETTRAKERIESELNIARKLQMSLLPNIFPPFPEWKTLDLYASLSSAKEVGGDLYDFFIRDRKLFFTVGDVSGKGIPASLFMAVTRSLFRIMAGSCDTPSEIAAKLNHAVMEQNDANMFVTMFIGVLDLVHGNLSYCSAGHNPPLLVELGNKISFLDTVPNIPIGVCDGFKFAEQRVMLPKESALLVYTDGLTEAENNQCELLGNERVLEDLSHLDCLSARNIVERMTKLVTAFAGEAQQSDDLTLLCVRLTNNI